MSDLRKAAEQAVDYIVEALARHDEAYERHPSTEHERQVIVNDLEALRQALAQKGKECIYPECETGIGCDGPCGEKPVDTVNTSQECVDETAKRGHEPVAWHEPGAYGNVTTHKDWALANGWEPLYKERI